MARVSQEALEEALRGLATLDLTSPSNSALEAFLVAKRLNAAGHDVNIGNVDKVVEEIFGFDLEHPRGRVRPFVQRDDGAVGPQWGDRAQSGRKTVWNVTSRAHGTLAESLFASNDIRNGLAADAAEKLGAALKQSGSGDAVRPSRQGLAAVLLRNEKFDDSANESDFLKRLEERFGIDGSDLADFAEDAPLSAPLVSADGWAISALPSELRPPATHIAATRGAAADVASAKIFVDDRIRRMVRTAIASTSAVILVGPPGTGKTQLLREVLDEVRDDPTRFGFSKPTFEEPKWRTPEESWTTRELVGGETIDENGDLRFRPGDVLRSIREDRWLVLDEANRADMDKIFGGLLTWLSDQPVELGRTSTALDAPAVELGWRDEPGCDVEGWDELGASPPGSKDRVRFLAGTDWRLLGTYNAQDAQRVFRFGQAIGRRFVRVPIPPPSRGAFDKILDPFVQGLPPSVASSIGGLYESHQGSEVTRLGPALFLRLPAYVKAALERGFAAVDPAEASGSTASAATSGATPAVESSGGGEEAEDAANGDAQQPDSKKEGLADQLVAEAYLANIGTWLARYPEDELRALGERVISGSKALPKEEWEWLHNLIWTLG